MHTEYMVYVSSPGQDAFHRCSRATYESILRSPRPSLRYLLVRIEQPRSLEEVPCLYWAMRAGKPLDPADARVLLLVDEAGTIVVAGIVAKAKKNKMWDVRFWMVLEAMRHEAERLGWRVGRFIDVIT